mgnify:FL=1
MHKLIPLLALSTLTFTGCGSSSEDNPLACRDGSCAHQSELTFCDIDRAYPDTVQPNECIAPPAADACNRVMECSDPAKPYCNDDSMGTCVECTDNSECTVDGESCNTNSGECVDGEVIPCTPGAAGDSECAAKDVGLDFCSDGGICAECLVDVDCSGFANEGVCDSVNFECRACEVGGSDCESGLCGTRDAGECVATADVIRVDGANTGGDVEGCGAVGSECETIGFALTEVDDGTRNIVVVAAGTYDEALEFTNESATLIADGEVIVKAGLPVEGDTVISITGSSEVSFDGFIIEPGAAIPNTHLVTCLGATAALSLSNSTVRNSQGLGITSTCGLTVTASTISGNAGGGIHVNGGNFTIVNNFIVDNVSTGTIGGAKFEATDGLTEVLDFNTFARNQRSGTEGFSLICDATNLTARNNIFMLADASTAGVITQCATSFALIDSGSSTAAIGDNFKAEAVFVAPGTGDYHLMPGSPGTNAADPTATLAIDIDGEARPQGGRHDIGADEAE